LQERVVGQITREAHSNPASLLDDADEATNARVTGALSLEGFAL
jgi:hypothetical protein